MLVREDLYQHLAGAAEMSDDDKWRLGWLCHPLRTLSDWSHSTIFRRLGKELCRQLVCRSAVEAGTLR